MNSNATPLLAVFEKKMRLEVPLFQRQYVWNREQQWEPLWEDISRKFDDYLAGRKDTPVHFLGAMVLDQKQTPTTYVEKRQVIDGQQRLTTLQIFLAAFRDFCGSQGCSDLADECESFTLNRGMMADAEVERFKVWPTQQDREQFVAVMTSKSREAVEEQYPLVKRKYARKYDPRPRMVEAYLFYMDQLAEFFVGTEDEPPPLADQPIAARLDECFQALKNALQVVIIDLEHGDDAQVIFETLNARGEPLLPADLLRNYIFLRAARMGESQEDLYKQYWLRFDDEFWRKEVRQGRLKRPRSDLFLQHFLASQQTIDIPVRHLYVEYKYWIERVKPFSTVREELKCVSRFGDHFRRILVPRKSDVIYDIATFLEVFDIRTAYPLFLQLLDSELSDTQWKRIAVSLESYLLRRSVCGLTTKNYNRVFLTMTRTMRQDGTTPERVRAYLSGLTGDSAEWPSDDRFRSAWMVNHAYQTLKAKVQHVLRRLNETFYDGKTERVTIESELTVEHILPQKWVAHWPLPDGASGLEGTELWTTPRDDARAAASHERNAALQRIGNLTILTQPLNSSVSNQAWAQKKPALLAASVLPINQELQQYEHWDETAIDRRSEALFERALRLWPGPSALTD